MRGMPGSCSACGGPLEAGARFCPLCGQTAAVPSPTTVGRPGLPSGNDPATLDTVKRIGWNWGGFFIPYLWLLGHGRTTAGFLLLLTTAVPLLNVLHLILYPATAIYLGLQGYEISWRHRAYHSVEQLRDGEREWAWWGALVLLLVVGGVFLSLVYLRGAMDQVWREMDLMGR